jgi:DNA processing protein
MTAEQQALLRLHLTPKLGRASLFKLRHHFNSFQAALHADKNSWRQAGLSEKLYHGLPPKNSPQIISAYKLLEKLKITIIDFWDARYPKLLKEIHDPPAALYVRGELPNAECLAIVGSRRATPAGRMITQELAAELACRGICIVSGLASGIDSAAHRGALDGSGQTIAVLGCGVERAYPQENAGLYRDILENNCILSEYPPGTPPLPRNFPARNRIISGLSKGVLIVEAAAKSGSLITGDFALEQGRELFAMPGTIKNPNSNGTNQLLKQGACLVTEHTDIIDVLWPQATLSKPHIERTSQLDDLPQQHREVYRHITLEPLHCDEIARKCGLTPMELSAILLDLELRGVVQTLPGNLYIRGCHS